MNDARFEPGMTIPAWSPMIGVSGSALVVAVSPDRRFVWLVDLDKAETTKAGAKRVDISCDPRFGEKATAYPDFCHREFRVFRADRATGRMAVPQRLVPDESALKSA